MLLRNDTSLFKRLLILLLLLTLAACGGAPETPTEPSAAGETTEATNDTLILATTTSTYDSGLLDFIIPDFEEQAGATVDIVSVGTGAALELGANGDADVLLVHAPEREAAFVEAGNGTERFDVMYNDFIIVGPEADPAAIGSMAEAAAALAAIAEAEARFVSRGDDSGTHTKELNIWEAAAIEPEGDWYQQAGQGMGAVLNIANEQQAYTLTDRATFLTQENIELEVLVEGDEMLFNPYGVIPVNPETHLAVNHDLATQFVDWLTSVETQEMIATYEVADTQLFFPDSAAYNEDQAS